MIFITPIPPTRREILAIFCFIFEIGFILLILDSCIQDIFCRFSH
jgi:hypothetical protein